MQKPRRGSGVPSRFGSSTRLLSLSAAAADPTPPPPPPRRLPGARGRGRGGGGGHKVAARRGTQPAAQTPSCSGEGLGLGSGPRLIGEEPRGCCWYGRPRAGGGPGRGGGGLARGRGQWGRISVEPAAPQPSSPAAGAWCAGSAPSAFLVFSRRTAGRRRPLLSGPGAAEASRGLAEGRRKERERSRPGLAGLRLRQSAGADAGGGSAALGYLADPGAGRLEVRLCGHCAPGTAAAPARRLGRLLPAPPHPGPRRPPPLSPPPPSQRPCALVPLQIPASWPPRERAEPAEGAAPSPPGRPGPRSSKGDCPQSRIRLRRAAPRGRRHPTARRPGSGRDGPRRPAPARLMSAAPVRETRACAGPDLAAPPTPRTRAAGLGPLRARLLRRGGKERSRDGPASRRFGSGCPTRGTGTGTFPGLVTGRRQMDLDPRRGTAFLPSQD